VTSVRRRHHGVGLLVGVVTCVVVIAAGLGLVIELDGRRASAPTLGATLSLAEALGTTDAAGFERALAPRPFVFPADHGPHPTFRTEWWYWTGNLRASGGEGARRFGFQLTFFRTALAPTLLPRRSAWISRDVYLAHLAVTDVEAGRFQARDRWARGALDLAGAARSPLRVWLGDWVAEAPDAGEGWPLRLRAGDGDLRIDLTVSRGKPPVLQGDRGLSRKSAGEGNASYYYSLTRMPVAGQVMTDGRAFTVDGLAWMDREWSTSALAPDQVGWDWFALQLDDGRELMLYLLRTRDGGVSPESQGTLVAADGATRVLGRDAVAVEVLDHWTSPRGGTRYPGRWRIRVATEDLDITVTPLLADQELDLAVRYWEGAVRVEGTAGGARLRGTGYVELVGYARVAGETTKAVRQ
jgi:predicted secreted hydrolase